ncbi:hypothetical protein FB451DRAFT_1252004 [Mycena latifolia]|nr:hypothetical protein FB451DRAFT_1252004 [Mycena latifolia]
MGSTSPTPTCPIAALPIEILLGIFCRLDGKSILRCCLVCRVWQETVKNCTELKYIIELFADGLLPNPTSDLSPVEKQENLDQWRDAWQTISWKSRREFAIHAHPRAYELVGGVFAQQNTWPQSDFTAIHLPSSQLGSQITSTPNIGIESLDFAMDPTQDLVIFLHRGDGTGDFDCRAMSSLQPHPRASMPRLSFDLKNDNLRRIFLQVADDIVGLLFHTSHAENSLRIVLFNWRAGTLLVDINNSDLPLFVVDFALLSPRAFIVGCRDVAASPGRGAIHIYSFQGTHQNDPIPAATLKLPELKQNRFLERIIAHSGPFCAGPLPDAQFSKANDMRICVISLAYNHGEFYSLYVHHRYFEQYLLNMGPLREPRIVPWDEWGPIHSRMVPGQHRFWLRYVHGERVVRPVDSVHPNGTCVEIFDFGVTPSRSGYTNATHPPDLFLEASTISHEGHVFEKDMTTALPYRRTARWLDDVYILFMIDQDRLIGVNDSVNKLTVYTF